MTIVTVGTKKASPNEIVGIGFSRKDDNSPLTIAEVHEKGLFAKSPLVKGLVIKKINGKNMTFAHPRDAAQEILKSPSYVTISAEGFVARVKKPKKATAGIVLKDTNNEVIISKVKRNSLFSDTDLKAGMKIISINREKAPSTASEAINIIKQTDGKLKVVAVSGYQNDSSAIEGPEDEQSETTTYDDAGPTHTGSDYGAYKKGRIFHLTESNNDADSILIATIEGENSSDKIHWFEYQPTFIDRLCCRYSSLREEQENEKKRTKSLVHVASPKHSSGSSKRQVFPVQTNR
jgi:membrane-associated protease RseP (regulator of RpoE activity)